MRRVLIIDDEQDIRAISRMSVEKVGGWEALEADSGEKGIEIAAAEVPDVILLDAMMPGMDGAATIQSLKASESTKDIPVLFLTAKLQAADVERFRELGAEGVLSKPFDPMSLPDEVASALGWER
jgi:CheY-like chemotaxis protein